MSLEYRFKCMSCGHEWELYGDGLFAINLAGRKNCCDRCGCQLLVVEDCGSNRSAEVIDFRECNARLAVEIERKFRTVQDAFQRLAAMNHESEEYTELRAWLLSKISLNQVD